MKYSLVLTWLILLAMDLAFATEPESCELFLRTRNAEGVVIVKPKTLTPEQRFKINAVLTDYNPRNHVIIGINELRHGYLIAPGLKRFDAGVLSRGRVRTHNGEAYLNSGLFFRFEVDDRMAAKIQTETDRMLDERHVSCIHGIGQILGSAGIEEFKNEVFSPRDLLEAIEELKKRLKVDAYLLASHSVSYDRFVLESGFGRSWTYRAMWHWRRSWNETKRESGNSSAYSGDSSPSGTGTPVHRPHRTSDAGSSDSSPAGGRGARHSDDSSPGDSHSDGPGSDPS